LDGFLFDIAYVLNIVWAYKDHSFMHIVLPDLGYKKDLQYFDDVWCSIRGAKQRVMPEILKQKVVSYFKKLETPVRIYAKNIRPIHSIFSTIL
jgi:hypothetical protein